MLFLAEQFATLPDEYRSLVEDWVETFEIEPSADEPVNLVGLVLIARLTRLYGIGEVELEGSTETGLVTFGDRRPDGVVPVLVRASAEIVAQALASQDYRFELVAIRHGLTSIAASGVRKFRR